MCVIIAVKSSSQRVEGRQGEEAGAEEGLDPPGSSFGRIVWKSNQTGGGSDKAGLNLSTATSTECDHLFLLIHTSSPK